MAKKVEVFTVELNSAEAEDRAIRANKLIHELKEQQKALRKENKQGSEEYQRLTQKLDQANRIYRENKKAVNDITRSQKAATGSIQEQRSKLAALTKQWKEQGTATKDGQQKQAALAKEIRETSDSLKEQESAVGNNTRNVGNYKDAVNELAPGLSGAANKMKSLTMASLRFLATPIGAVIGAIAAALLTVTSYLRNTKEGTEKWDQALAVINATISVFVDRVSRVGEALFMIIGGDVEEGLEKIRTSFDGITDEVKEEAEATLVLTKNMQALVDQERLYSVEKAKSRKEIERLKLLAEDTKKTDEERIRAAKAANELELNLQTQGVELARERVRITKAEVEMSNSKAEDLDRLAQAEVELANIEAESFTRRIELNNKLNALEKGMEAQRQKVKDDDKKRSDRVAKEYLKAQENEAKKYIDLQDQIFQAKLTTDEKEIAAVSAKYDKLFLLAQESGLKDEELRAAETELIKLQEEEITRIKEEQVQKRADKENTEADKQKSIDAQVQSAKLAGVQNLANLTQGIAEENTAVAKAAGVTSATVSTHEGAAAALAPPPLGAGPILGPALAGVTIATGLLNVKKILEAEKGAMWFGNGGSKSGIFNGPSHARGGIRGSFSDGTNVEVEGDEAFVVVNKKDTPMLRHLNSINSRHGKPFLESGGSLFLRDGGYASSKINGEVKNGLDAKSIIRAMEKIRPVVTVEDFNSVASRVEIIENRARA